jgi:hypothetical protein
VEAQKKTTDEKKGKRKKNNNESREILIFSLIFSSLNLIFEFSFFEFLFLFVGNLNPFFYFKKSFISKK